MGLWRFPNVAAKRGNVGLEDTTASRLGSRAKPELRDLEIKEFYGTH
jgi:hypothetical protein